MSGNYDRKDHFYQKAKEAGYKSRAAYKLLELDQSHKLLKHNFKIADLGSWPGGWLQVASSKVGPQGLVVGADLVQIEDLGLENVRFVQGDLRDEETLISIKSHCSGLCDLVLSDMSPKLTGIREADQMASVACAELAQWVSTQILRPGGNLVIKVFKGNETEQFVKNLRPLFNKVVRCELDSTRKTSSEFYLIGLGFKPTTLGHGS